MILSSVPVLPIKSVSTKIRNICMLLQLFNLECMNKRKPNKGLHGQFLDGFLKKSFLWNSDIRAGGRQAGGRASSQINLLVNLFSKLYVTFILQWIAFIFGRDEEEDQ